MTKFNIVIESLKKQVKHLERDIEDKQGEIATAQSNIETFEYSCTDEEYNEYLDSVFDEVEICGFTFSASYALKELDPTAYRCGKSDYESDFEIENCEEYNDMVSELEELETELDELESQLDDLQSELDALESED